MGIRRLLILLHRRKPEAPSDNTDIGFREVVSLAKQGGIHFFCQRVRETISVVQCCVMAGPFSEPSMSRARDTRLLLRYWFDSDTRGFDEFIEPPFGLVRRIFFNARRTIEVSTILAAEMIGSLSVATHWE